MEMGGLFAEGCEWVGLWEVEEMKKDKIKKLLIIFLAAETILLVAISYNAYHKYRLEE